MTTPQDHQRAARLAMNSLEKMLIEMLIANEVGEVAVVVGWGQLEPQKRVTKRARVVKIARGSMEKLRPAE